MNRKTLLLTGAGLILLGCGIACWKLSAKPSSAVVPLPAARSDPESEEERTRRLLLGVWQDHYRGTRTMTLNEDGTGTMLVELGGLQSVLFAPKLRFDMRWAWDGKTLTKRTVGGEPADKVALILQTMGDAAADTVLEVTPDRLLLLDKDGQTRYDWKRLPVGGEEGDKGRD
jgi:hypothetical protein